ncbi:hypothetical protein VE03_06581 [Pseudogymnoascus sp. 23342-1-I1]|nr:hypothetical protein VE03_06581 [Pseudogymnoascus sp. 23342-1-I1]
MTSERDAVLAEASISALKGRLRRARDVSKNETSPDTSTLLDTNVRQQEVARKLSALATETIPKERLLPIELENERTHAGDVARQSNGALRALPPPRAVARSSIRMRSKADRGKRKKSKRLGDDSEDDSEDERRTRKGDQNSLLDMPTKKPATVMPSTSPSLLTVDEQERIRLRRTFRAAEEKWERFELDRNNYMRRRHDIERKVASTLHGITASLETKQRLHQSEDDVQAFLDATLFDYIQDQSDRIEDQLKGDGNSEGYSQLRSHHYLDEVLLRIEDGVIRRSKAFDEWASTKQKWDTFPPSKIKRMGSICLRMQAIFLKEIKGMAIDDETTIKNYIAQRLRDQGGDTGLSLRPSGSFLGPEDDLENQYFERLSTSLAPKDDLENQYFELLSASIAKSVAQDIKAGLSVPNKSSLELVHILETSRTGNCLSQEYVNWVTSALDDKQLSSRCESWFKGVRKETIDRFRSDLRGIDIRYEFIDSAEDPSDVFVVLFKGGIIANVIQVPPETLYRLGWCRDSCTDRYWRYSLGYLLEDRVFKVQMNGAIVGMATLEENPLGAGARFTGASAN